MRAMRPWIMLFGLAVMCLVTANASAQQTKKHQFMDRFNAMDLNHDGILTMQEFVATNPQMGAEKAGAFYKKLASLGGVTTKDGVTGMTVQQFGNAWKSLLGNSRPKQGTN